MGCGRGCGGVRSHCRCGCCCCVQCKRGERGELPHKLQVPENDWHSFNSLAKLFSRSYVARSLFIFFLIRARSTSLTMFANHLNWAIPTWFVLVQPYAQDANWLSLQKTSSRYTLPPKPFSLQTPRWGMLQFSVCSKGFCVHCNSAVNPGFTCFACDVPDMWCYNGFCDCMVDPENILFGASSDRMGKRMKRVKKWEGE